MAEKLYTARQVADLLGYSPGHVEEWLRAGWLESKRLPGGETAVSERGLVRFLRDRGIDLEAVLAEAERREAESRETEDSAGATGLPRDVASFGGDAAGRLAQAILADAVRRGAEAVHLDPDADGLTLRLKTDGWLREKPNFRPRLPDGLGPQLITRFQELAGLEPHQADTGRLRARLWDRVRSFRIVARPTPHGDRIEVHLPQSDWGEADGLG